MTLSVLFACQEKAEEKQIASDNPKLIELVKKDQEMRSGDMSGMNAGIDLEHRKQVFEMLAKGEIKTAKDKMNAALILQHTNLGYCGEELISESVENYYLATLLSEQAFLEGLEDARAMYAANLDRYLWLTVGIQKYGTQKVYVEEADDFYWVPIDTLTTDQERIEFGISPLKDLLEQASMNSYPKQNLL
ncbi:hypothetical protein [Algoriphagus confluentis]